MTAFNVGDKLRVITNCYPTAAPIGSFVEVVGDGALGAYWITNGQAEISMVNAYSQEFELMKQAVPDQPPQKPSKSASFVELLTSISVVRKTAMQSHRVASNEAIEALYAQESTHISLDTEGVGAYIVIKQDNEDFNGHLQENVIKLDIDEVEAVFSAIKKLTKQLGE